MIRWSHLFIDRPAARFDDALAFWTAVTGTTLSPRRGEYDEFVTLLPAEGDAHLKAQAVGDGGGAHIDLDVEDVSAYLDRALALGATATHVEDGFGVLRSPAGQAFCLCTWRGPATRPPRVGSAVDQICVDVAADRFDAEVEFWSALTGWTSRASRLPEFHSVRPGPEMPVHILIQRLDAPRPTSAHIDVACADVAEVRARHEAHGAVHVGDGRSWSVMRDPAGGVYCLTGRDPVTGLSG